MLVKSISNYKYFFKLVEFLFDYITTSTNCEESFLNNLCEIID